MQLFSVTMMLGMLGAFSGLATCVTLPALAAVTAASRSVASRPIADPTTNSTFPPMKWVGLNKGESVTLYGEASSIIAQLKELDADWAPKMPGDDSTAKNGLDSRQSVVQLENHLTCCPVGGWPWYPTDASDMKTAINNLDSISGYFEVNPHSCAMASSSGSAGIWVCNDDNIPYGIVPQWLQNFANEMGECSVCGQMFADEFSYMVNMITHRI